MSKIKLEINQNTNPKTILFLIILSSLIFIFFFSSYIYTNIKTKDYVKTTAVIKELNYDTNYYSDTRTSHYIILNYKYNNKEYNYKQKITFTFNNQEGTIKNIHINPNNPTEVKNIYNNNATILLSIMSLLFDIMCIIIYKKLKTKNLNNS